MMNFNNKHVLVLGLARSGVSAVRVLHRHGAKVIVNDAGKPEKMEADVKAIQGLVEEIVLGEHPLRLLDGGLDLIVKNPGIPYDIPILDEARKRGIPIVSEVELAYQVTQASLIGITGSNGKTTTTSWVGEIMKYAHPQVHVAGNIGLPLSQEVDGLGADHLVIVELSSFQLNDILEFRPHVAALINIYPAHIDWHHSPENYLQAKSNIFKNQIESDWAVLNADNLQVMSLKPNLKSGILTFSSQHPVEQGAWIANDMLIMKINGKKETVLPLNQLGIGYAHNVQNAMAAALISYCAGASYDAIRQGLKSFKGVRHRFQIVDTINQVLYVNDSKATNSQAALTALELPQTPIVWIAGGLDRGQDVDEIAQKAAKYCKSAILLGQTKERFAEALKRYGLDSIYLVQSMAEAVVTAKKISLPGDTVLLSPACASWDMYPSFEHRGDDFIDQVTKK
jgi:UDP-N-acetylmuramoylalanine--D-glutamate ligase